MAKKKGGGGGGGGGKKKASSSKGGVGGSGAEKNAATKRGGKAKKRNGKSKSNHSSTSSSSDDDDDTQFRAQLLNQGHLIREMNSDGNCLFRSLSDQLYNDDGDEHGTVREEICDFLQEHKEEFQSFLLMDEDDEDIMNIDDYVEHMREHMTWGSDIEEGVIIEGRSWWFWGGEKCCNKAWWQGKKTERQVKEQSFLHLLFLR